MANIAAPIVEVTVYTDRARITRRGTAHLSAGEQTLVLGDLPPTIDGDSVRAGGRGAGVRILSVELQQRFVTEAPEERIATLNKQIQALQDELLAAADADKAAQARLRFLKTLRDNGAVTLGKSFAYGQASLDDTAALVDYLDREWQATLQRRREVAAHKRDLDAQLAALQAELNQAQPTSSIARNEIQVVVEAAAETDLQLELVYVANGASWQPIYDARLVESKVAFTYLAGVSQQTGEDWPAVQLLLSTARPAVSRGIPELDPWYIDVPRPPMPRFQADYAVGGAAPAPQAASRAMYAAETEVPPPAQVAEATIESSGAAVTYRVAHPVAVPADGAPHRTTVTTLDLDAQLDYVAVPKLAEEAYLRASVRNGSRYIFLPGSASIFHDDDFVGTTDLELIVPNEEFEMQLGVDSRVKVERELAERTTAKSFIGNTRRVVYGYRIKVTNLLERPAQVTVWDQLPLPRHEEIKVKLQDATPPPTEQSDLGILKWQLTLDPQQTQTITFSFLIEHPRNMTLTGIS